MRTLAASEHQLQASLCDYLQFAARPELFWFAIPNGGKRHVHVALQMKKEGAKRGVPDLAFLLPEGHTAWLEMKVTGGRLSPDQKTFRDKAIALGHSWGVAKTLDEAIAYLASIGALKGTPK
jgi:hypothetical protein